MLLWCKIFTARILLLTVQLAVPDTSLPGLTLKVLVATIDAQWEGMGDVGSARYDSMWPDD